MSTRILLALCCACMLWTFESCAPSSAVSAKASSLPFMIGKIDLIGNEPFVKPVLWIDETHLFQLRTTKGLEKELIARQRTRVKVYYSGRQEKGIDHYLDVDHIEQVEQNN